MDLESPWSDFYDLLLQDETSPSETEEEWTSVQKTARGQIECQPIINNKEDENSMSIDPEFQTMVNHVLATVSQHNKTAAATAGEEATSGASGAQRHYHFHHHNHHRGWTTMGSGTKSTSDASSSKKRWPVMPGTFIRNDNHPSNQCACVHINKPPSFSPNQAATTAATSTIRVMDVHAWITSIAFVAHLLLLWFRP